MHGSLFLLRHGARMATRKNKFSIKISCLLTCLMSSMNSYSEAELEVMIKPTHWDVDKNDTYITNDKDRIHYSGEDFAKYLKECEYAKPCDGINGQYFKIDLLHTGLDYDKVAGDHCIEGQDESGCVFSAASGRIASIHRKGDKDHGMGNVVIIEHYQLRPYYQRIYTLYAHLAWIKDSINANDFVKQGTIIGEVGGTGHVNNQDDYWPDHLHFEIKTRDALEPPEEICKTYRSNVFNNLHYISKTSYGYTSPHPDICGYFNPDDYIGNYKYKFLPINNTNNDWSKNESTPNDGTDNNSSNTSGSATIQQTTPTGSSQEAITGKQSDLRPTFNVENAAGGEISAVCNTCSSKPVDPGQRIRLRLTAQIANADAGDYKRNKNSKTIEGPVWWQIEGKTGWLLLASSEYTIGKLDKDENVKETHDWNVPNYPGEILALKACIDGDDEIYEEGESSRTRKITDPDQGGTTNNCSRKERFYIRYPNHDPTGAVESYDCTKVTGWAKDQNTADSLSVQVSVANPDGTNGQPLGTLAANTSRSDLGGNYGFQWTPPASFKDGQPRMVTFTAVNVPEGPNRVIGSVPLTCANDVSAAAIIPIITNVVLADPNLTVVVQGGGTVTSSPKGIDCPGACSESFDGPTVTLAARAKKGSAFVGWVNACGQSKTSASCKLQLNDDRTVTAVFKKIATK